ncbi:NAD(P)-dependent oxidoreductase [Bacillus salitolerans]|uniref:NAD(P)-dependent oxidoreductase n=1 Tax=Bacillus salitolerans TaxID=1437434 RepID=A0ABW4LK36_9BACI
MTNSNVIGFIGTGVMGKSMVKHFMRARYEVNIYTRTKDKAAELIDMGANWMESVANLSASSHYIMTMVGYPEDVEEVYFGENGIINHALPGSVLVDFTTSSPSLAKKIYRLSKEKNLHAMDAPVSGGDIGARDGTLTIMVGGDQSTFGKVSPILSLVGKNVVLQGDAGAGQHTKMCNQIAIASNMMGVCEALVYAKQSGLEPEKVLQSISAGAAGSWSLSNLAPRMLQGNFEPGFYVKHFIKDMKIALEEAEKMNLKLPGLALAKKLYDELSSSGEENSGTQALIKLWSES